MPPSDIEGLRLTKMQLNAIQSVQRYILGMAQSAKIEKLTEEK